MLYLKVVKNPIILNLYAKIDLKMLVRSLLNVSKGTSVYSQTFLYKTCEKDYERVFFMLYIDLK
jgi:hypothetical protein